MTREKQKRGILERLKDGGVLGDGGYILELERRGYVQAGPYTPEVAIEHPEALRQLHQEFLRAGSDVLQALTFYASRDKLATTGYANRMEAINRSAVRIAREVAGDQALVAGTLCVTWQYRPGNAQARARVRRLFEEQITAQAAEGVNFFICETLHYVGEAVLATRAIKQAGYPAMVTLNFKGSEQSSDGHEPEEVARILIGEGADIVGANCGRDPARMLPIVEKMRKAVKTGYIAAQPAAYRTREDIPYFMGRPEFPLGLDPLTLTRGEMAAYAVRARDMGVNYIGACCGTVAAHIRSMAEALGRKPAAGAKSPELEKHPILGTPRSLKGRVRTGR
ncbi:MAG: homocysteine S-methyltransferase family protein [Candidatus Rokubacteria bacterium]|nr:homocysteine S-methyltransferase family protein [Candidatus Rokubacteria bacterium]